MVRLDANKWSFRLYSRSMLVSGVYSEGLTTRQFPAASAGASFTTTQTRGLCAVHK